MLEVYYYEVLDVDGDGLVSMRDYFDYWNSMQHNQPVEMKDMVIIKLLYIKVIKFLFKLINNI